MSTPDIYQALRESHEIQRAWCTRLTRTRATNPQGRRDAFLTLKVELAATPPPRSAFCTRPC